MKPWPCPIINFTRRPVAAVPRRSAGRGVPPGAGFRPAGRDGCVTALPARFPATAAAPEAATTGGRLGSGLIDGQASAADLGSVQRRDRLLRLVVRAHLDEREAARTAGHLIPHDGHRLDRARPPEQLLQLAFTRFVRQIADVQLPTHDLYSPCRGATFPIETASLARACAMEAPRDMIIHRIFPPALPSVGVTGRFRSAPPAIQLSEKMNPFGASASNHEGSVFRCRLQHSG